MQSIKIPNIFGNVSKTGAFSPAVFLFNCAYCIYFFVTLLNISFFAMYISRPILKMTIMLVLLLLCTSVLCSKKHSVKSIVLLAITGILLIVICLRMMTRIEFLPIFLFLYCARNINPEKIARLTVIISIAVLVLVILSAQIGIIPNYVNSAYVGGELRIRHYLGFRYALQPSGILFNTVSMDMYLHRNNLSKYRILFWIAASCIMFLYTDSRLSFVFSLIVIAGFIVINRFPKLLDKLTAVRILMVCSFIICAAVSFIIAYKYNPSVQWMSDLNEALEYRLKFAHDGFQNYQLKLFGQNIRFVGNGVNAEGVKSIGVYNYIDCFYEHILLKYGIIFFVIVITGFTVASYLSMKKKDYHLLLLFALLAVHAIIDDLVILLNYNTLWFFIMPLIAQQGYASRNKLLSLRDLIPKRKRKFRFKFTL